MEPLVGLLVEKFHSRAEYCEQQAARSCSPAEREQWLIFATRWLLFAKEQILTTEGNTSLKPIQATPFSNLAVVQKGPPRS
jgi:hypothetical protein